ncbi:MAG: tRNA pseudouridine(55) synthase TruB [Pseudomonadota bacterium]
MTRRRKGRPVHGWLILDKPLEMTSTHAVGKVKRLFGAQKAGHAGTLDPLATGILPMALGEATKTVSFAMDGPKAYRFTVRWGIETSTDDVEGEVLRMSQARPTQHAIEAQLQNFLGAIMQVPPRFSAIKVGGNRAYDLARDGEQLELAAREVSIEQLKLVAMPNDDSAVFEAICGKGTYVRAIARDLGRALGCFGHVIHLRRTKVGPFIEKDAWTLEALENLTEKHAAEHSETSLPATVLLPIETALGHLPHLELSSSDAARIAQGQSIFMRGRHTPVMSGLAYTSFKGKVLALVQIERGEVRPTRVFNFGK